MALRILHFVPYLTGGGVAGVWMNLTKAFAKLGNEVYLVGPYVSHLKDYVNLYEVSKAPPIYIRDPFYTLAYVYMNRDLLKKILKEENIDIMLTHGPLIAICLEGNITSRIRCYSVIHGTYANEVRWMRFHPISGLERSRYMLGIRLNYHYDMKFYSFLSRRGVKFIAVSLKTGEELANAGLLRDSIYSILNGVDKHFFKPVDKSEARNHLKEKFNVKAEGFLIVHVGLSPLKGTHVLVKALALLKRKNLKFTALLIGRVGPKTYKYHLEKIIKAFKLTEHIKMLGSIGPIDLLQAYNAADLTVVPSYSEGGPLTIPESLACGTPVIATDVGGNAEYLEMVGLSNLSLQIRSYDFSNILFKKLVVALENLDYLKTKALNNIGNIPSWEEVAKKYIELSKYV